ncbi:hypothetical protein RJ640_018359 [Escallonia rubra]|uniref:Uncharacterized protein n=1 Tax=Escallonia rubra TaxID=112253 RepID=A0AA88RPJ6_9ASTE|nr:hypothetical protein RJ640_018359 [Escallonia rubra]
MMKQAHSPTPKIYYEICRDGELVVERERMPSSAPSKENGKENEDPVSDRNRLLGSVREMINEVHADPTGSDQPPATCIFKVPDELRELKASAYTPRVVSLGPLHKDDKHLHKGIGHKKRYMHSLFLRSRSTDEAVEADKVKTENICVDAMLEMVDVARACYDASHGLCEDDDVKFAEMLILDGCFLLELFYKFKQLEFCDERQTWSFKRSATDLDRAGVNFVACRPEKSLDEEDGYLGVKFKTSCWFDWLCGTSAPSEIPTYLSHLCCCFSWFCQTFGRHRFEIPKLCIFYDNETLFRNLFAFEQCCPYIERRYITSYAYLMDTLINTKEDIELLEDAGVIDNGLRSSEDASDLFNNLCKEVTLVDFFFLRQWKQVDDYCKRRWPRRLALLRRSYFGNPWSGISVIAALILFALTVVQTVYSIRSSA